MELAASLPTTEELLAQLHCAIDTNADDDSSDQPQ
jgi:hypothetical protein